MKLNNISPSEGSTHSNKRKGRGLGSGLGKTAGRGHKGQKARSGGGVRWGFEGGQTPMFRRVPKRGFNNKRFQVSVQEVSLDQFNAFEDGTTVTLELMKEAGLINPSKKVKGLKVLANGTLERKLTIEALGFTQKAKEAIEALGGTAQEV